MSDFNEKIRQILRRSQESGDMVELYDDERNLDRLSEGLKMLLENLPGGGV